MEKYDVAIVGTGPAGMFCAMELKKLRPDLKIAMFEKGKLRKPGDKNLTSGWGGAGAFSDGKLTLSHKVGGELVKFTGASEFYELIQYVQSIYIDFGGSGEIDEPDPTALSDLVRRASNAGFELMPYSVHHFGSDYAWQITQNIHDYLMERGVDIYKNAFVSNIVPEFGGYWIIVGNRKYLSRNVLVAVGREGEDWWVELAKKLKLRLKNNAVDIGFRVEVADDVLEEWVKCLRDLKLRYRTSLDETVRTFCVCPSGYIDIENYRGGLKTTNGFSYKDPSKKSGNTNFALLNSTFFTHPFKDPVGYGRKIAGIANDLSGGKVIVQRLLDFERERRTTWERLASAGIQSTLKKAEPGDLRRVIPEANMKNLREGLEALKRLIPAIGRNNGNDTLLLGVEIKFYSARIELNKNLETKLIGFFVAGDASGYTRGLLQSSMMGILVARHIASKP